MKISARNVLKGTVKHIELGPVSAEVTIMLPGGEELVSVITRGSAEALELAVGRPVMAVIKASQVMVAVD